MQRDLCHVLYQRCLFKRAVRVKETFIDKPVVEVKVPNFANYRHGFVDPDVSVVERSIELI